MLKKQPCVFSEKVALVGTECSNSILFPGENSQEGNDKFNAI